MKKSILFILFLLSFSTSVFGEVSVSGKVVNDTGNGLPSVTVQIKGTQYGTTTDIDGKFEIMLINKEQILIFLHVGYEKVELDISQLKSMYRNIVILKEDKKLHKVIVTDSWSRNQINYWAGISYNPYGVSAQKSWFSWGTKYREIEAGFSTNFTQNTDFYGKYGRRILHQFITYKFQQTTFIKSESKNRIITHLLENNHALRFFDLTYGIGYQKFEQENISSKNVGLNLGVSKGIPYVALCSVKSLYWLDYWAWEIALDRNFKRKIHTSISYRQTTQDFKEINLTLGYIF